MAHAIWNILAFSEINDLGRKGGRDNSCLAPTCENSTFGEFLKAAIFARILNISGPCWSNNVQLELR